MLKCLYILAEEPSRIILESDYLLQHWLLMLILAEKPGLPSLCLPNIIFH